MKRHMSAGKRGDEARKAATASGPPSIEPISVRIATAVQLTGIPRTTLYELIKSGEIATVKIGRSTFIPYRCLKHLIDG